MDRNSNNHTDLQSLQDQRQSNRIMTGELSSRIDRSSTSDDTCHNTEQGQLAQDSPPVNEHNVNKSLICEHLSCSNEIRQGTSENVCVLKTGHACIWHIDDMEKRINDLINGRESIIDSIIFPASKNGDLLRACVYLNDTINPTFISTNPRVIELADELVKTAAPGLLSRVFFSDDGSTAIEVAIKMALQYFQLTGHPERRRFVAFEKGYHGDTLGAASLGGIDLFHGRFSAHHFPVEHVASVADLDGLPEPGRLRRS